ncbi:MAG: signal recognition particle-docking protein FtsY [Alphaproteobacteria bacterium]|nr:signal recognition particle-docking protein FtsY [Alphaproteobacteria bacterium]
MVFWRKKRNIAEQEQEEREEKLFHPKGEPAIELSTDYEAELDDEIRHEMEEETSSEILDDLRLSPAPEHDRLDDAEEAEEFADDSNEGGWLSRLTSGLSKSTNKITKGLTDLVTKKTLDQETLDGLEDLLIEADLGPKTAAKIIEEFSKDRFGKEISEEEIREALAETISGILKPVAKHLTIEKPDGGPFTVIVCGVNGVGKTTTIGKIAQNLKFKDHRSVMMAAGDTFRAAAVEQLGIWAKRTGAALVQKDVGADAASVAFEAYEQAKDQGVDVLLIDTAGRLQNKANLMDELAKIVRVLKKQDESLPHEVLLVLDATTGQNAFSQLEIFKDMVNVTGLIVTKLDGSAKGGVLVGLADQFGVPVYSIGIGEGLEDLQPFCPREYARALMGLEN